MKTTVKTVRVYAYLLSLIFTFFDVKFLKLSTQWVKYALGCVYIDLFIGEMKKKKAKRLEFIGDGKLFKSHAASHG